MSSTLPYPHFGSPAGPYTQGVSYVYDDAASVNGVTGLYRPLMAKDFSPDALVSARSPNLDAFSRLRVSEGVGIFDSTFQYDLQPLIFHNRTIGSASITHNKNIVSAALTVGVGNGDTAIVQSKQYHRYLPAKSALVAMTQIIGAPILNVRKRLGYFDADNGLFFEQNGTEDIAMVRRTKTSGSVVDNRVAQEDWNIDKLDGSGNSRNPSGLVLDPSKSQILILDFQWLGMGRVRIGFDINGSIIYCHEFLNANILDVPYMQTGNLPIRWEVQNTGASAGATMYATCCSVQSEGGFEADRGYSYSVNTPLAITAGTTKTHLLSIRPATGYNGQINRVQIQPHDLGVLAGNNAILVETWYNPTLAGGAWNSPNAYSAAEWGTGQTISAPGVRLSSFFMASSASSRDATSQDTSSRRYPIVVDMTGFNPIPFTITATSLTSTSACYAEVEWVELL
jgi:hypothetical protein